VSLAIKRRPRFAVSPAAEYVKRSNLFAVLGQALGVRFASGDANEEVAGAVVFSSDGQVNAREDIPTLTIVAAQETVVSTSLRIELSDDPELEPLLRNVSLLENQSWRPSTIPVAEGDVILARAAGRPVWSQKRGRGALSQVVSILPKELAEDEVLRDRFCDGNAFSILPFLSFVRAIPGARGFRPPAPRAAFVIDDPNLRASSYGHIHLPSLVRLAEQHNFHVALATIPLDMWWASRAVATFVRQKSEYLSLALHGNNHSRGELNWPISPEVDLASMAQAMRRTSHFEKRYDVPVSNVMIPPHERYSRSMLGALKAVGVDALCADWPAPWVPRADRREVLNHDSLRRWFPASDVDGMPIIHREWIGQRNPARNFLFDALLGQPLIPYCHHGDFRDGYEWLCDLAGAINKLGTVRWQSLSGISSSNFDVQQEGATLRVRLFSRRIDIPVPEGIHELVIEVPGSRVETAPTAKVNGRTYELTPVENGCETTVAVDNNPLVSVAIRDRSARDPSAISRPPVALGPMIRRAVTETRDRLAPFVDGLRRRP
jgi:hypothetical protein